MTKTRILILGGTTEARELAGRLAVRADLSVEVSLAGRTEKPVRYPIPVRSGGFGGVDGLARYLTGNAIDLLIDATHPYAARMSANAADAAVLAQVPVIALRRPPWVAGNGDNWTEVADPEAAAIGLGAEPRRVFLALGRNEIAPFERAPWHSYLVRSVDPIDPALDLPDVRYVLDRGPFEEPEEEELLATNRVDTIVCKNSGGSAAYAKLVVARRLGIQVVMIRRPELPAVPSATDVDSIVVMIDHVVASRAKRGE